MKRFSLLLLLVTAMTTMAADYQPADYVWTTQSKNASESMPCGGHDLGMNVWVEDGDLLFYLQQSGWFDENNTLLKAGRWRLHVEGNPFAQDFEQRLCLADGAIYIKGTRVKIRIWADVFEPIAFVEMDANKKMAATLSYESWRYQDRLITKAACQQCSYKWNIPSDCATIADKITAKGHQLEVLHINKGQTVFDYTVTRERLDDIKSQLHDPLAGRTMRVSMDAPAFSFKGKRQGQYASTDYQAWDFSASDIRKTVVRIQADNYEKGAAAHTFSRLPLKNYKKRSAQWWHDYWQRSWIMTDNEELKPLIRNYELFRYMLGCNAYSEWPTKFNGGMFTFDPVYVDSAAPFTPDYRKWGGGTMTAQNQRLVYWPMLKSGDTDMMKAQFDTYLRMLPNAKARTRYYWNHDGACFTEQTEIFGLPNPAEYGKFKEGSAPGVERNAWLEYEWDTVLEFCLMILQAQQYANFDITPYEQLIKDCLTFFDEHYQYESSKRGLKALDGNGKLTIYPGSGCETYKMAYNPSSTIAALQALHQAWGKDSAQASRIPEIPLRHIDGKKCIAPAVIWERIQNVETPQLYPVFPWRIYGLGRPEIDIARNTYLYDPHAIEMRSSKGWKQDAIWAACLGLTDEAARLMKEKFADGPYRFPAFWEPAFDWAPDCNRGGSAMISLQEMLLQETPDGQLLLFPAWPKSWNIKFKLHATGGRTVVAEMKNGNIITQ